uniref:(northern house mosquito) hypothetical protein n=1 Tax=Culex pipiens TaxID=7175 RepID=A0A8D8B5I6_CULPI
MSDVTERVLHHSFEYFCLLACVIFVRKKLMFRKLFNKKTRRIRWASRLGLLLFCFFFFWENFPIDGPLWEVRQMLLMFGEDTRVCFYFVTIAKMSVYVQKRKKTGFL